MTATTTRPRRRPPKVHDDQLALVGIDQKLDDLNAHEKAACDARIEHDDRERSRHAQTARLCRCGPRAWGDARDHHCVRCGREITTKKPED
jgi:hypothetical protein